MGAPDRRARRGGPDGDPHLNSLDDKYVIEVIELTLKCLRITQATQFSMSFNLSRRLVGLMNGLIKSVRSNGADKVIDDQ
jgi:hypothetical protein